MFFNKFFKKKVVVRIAPSPTGYFHLGTARTALFNFVFAKKYGGEFILRIENTDKERNKEEYEKSIIDGIKWLGLSYDKFYRQSERTEIYKEYLRKMLENGKAYVSKEEAGEGKSPEVIRLKNEGCDVTFHDEIHGDITFNTKELGNFVIAKDINTPLYHLAVVVDDHEMGVTHVIRGEDHISNTPRQILISEAIGAKKPTYAHLPLILAPDRSKLSKRHGAVSLDEYKNMGYLPEAMVNFLALLGWSPQGKDSEGKNVFSLKEFVKNFDLIKVGKSGAIFDLEKLNWLNREHLKSMPKEKLFEYFKNGLPDYLKNLPEWSEKTFLKIIPILLERVVKSGDLIEMGEAGELDYFFKTPDCRIEKLFWKKDLNGKVFKENIDGLISAISSLSDDFEASQIKNKISMFISKNSLDTGSILWPMRYALSGLEKSPDPFIIASVIGKEKTLHRILAIKEKIK